MELDEKATSYQYGNGRFDLMTDEQVRTLTGDALQSILVRLASLCRQGENPTGEEIYHRLRELHLRYPHDDFALQPMRVKKHTRSRKRAIIYQLKMRIQGWWTKKK